MFWCTGVLASPQPGDFYTSGPRSEKRIALSFDDGPGPSTSQFLDLLDRHGVKATFFVLGQEVEKRPAVLKKIADRGHEIGNHLWNHANYKKREQIADSPDEVKQELAADLSRTKVEIQKSTPVPVNLLRMPHGIDRPWIKDVARQQGYVIVNWTFGADWHSKPADELSKDYVDALRPGAVFLLHDGGGHRKKSLAIAETLIKEAKAQGYAIVPIGELIGLKTP